MAEEAEFVIDSILFKIDKFDGNISNFIIWKIRVKAVLRVQGLHGALSDKPNTMGDDDWEVLQMKTASTIRLSLTKNVFLSVRHERVASKLWWKLENLYMPKLLVLKIQWYGLKMKEGADLAAHIDTFRDLRFQLLYLGAKIDDEDAMALLMASLPPSYDNFVASLIIRIKVIDVEDFIANLLSFEKLSKGYRKKSQMGKRLDFHLM